MKITALKRQKKHLTLVSFEDGEILLDNDVCTDHSLKAGADISKEKAEELLYESEYARAKSRALWYLDRADQLKGDERRLAEGFAARCLESNVSARETVRKLIEKGVPADIAKEVVSGSDTDEDAQIIAVIEKKYARKLETENGAQKVYAALIRKGFSFSAVKKALKKYSEELEYSEE